MALINYTYHAIAAVVFNLRAKHWSSKMRRGNPKPGSGARLRDIGKRSSAHEKVRDEAASKIKSWIKRLR